MAQLIDTLITGAVVMVAVFLTAKYLWKLVNPPKHLHPTCIACDSGCEIRDIRNEYHKKQHQLQVNS
ncbi:MAG: hypothetical protein K9N34_03805 [Candidatus Marinimicrobia bacterium]|nr:hypothetical protein [Candidatus Neomarinimicrobiota bacterium]MCF7839823.1 hypothetical protein [Candidatus Neomarinimicrobiota bacterium]MCF7902070.1 hypothetical protein [Candidatus Neomarinimicrobiota bacterium]